MNRHSSVADKTAHVRQYGGGVAMQWKCYGCNQIKGLTGSRGAGVWKRCQQCVEKKAARVCAPA